MASHDEVIRLTSPGSPPLDALLIEVNGGATSTFKYDLFVVPKGSAASGEPVATLVGATRSEQAYGANLRWRGPAHLRVEYLQARSVRGGGAIEVNGQSIELELVSGVTDRSAPAGGMEYNLRPSAGAGASGSR